MRRLSFKQKRQLLCHSQRSFRRKLRQRQKAKAGRSGRERTTERDQSDQAVLLRGPEDFSLSRNYDEVVALIEQLRERGVRRAAPTRLDFRPIQRLSPAAALMLAAELDRWRRVHGIRLKPYKMAQWNPTVRRALLEMGLFDLLDIDRRASREETQNSDTGIHVIKFCSDTRTIGKEADDLQTKIGEATGQDLVLKQELYNGLVEAMNNVLHHAYVEELQTYKYPWLQNRWWMAGSCNRRRNYVRILFYDQGVGIPSTLPKWTFWEQVTSLLSILKLPVNHHGAMIRAAMEVSRTRTGERSRGRGLGQIRRFVESIPGAKLRVLSGRGEYIYYQERGEEIVHTHSKDLGGTLIEWQIPLVIPSPPRKEVSHDHQSGREVL